MSGDDAIILQLTRENARLKLANDLLTAELDSIAETLAALGMPNPHLSEGFGPASRMHMLQAQIKAFPLKLSDRYHRLEGDLFSVTFPTSIEPVVDYVIAADKAAVERWVASHPGRRPGRDITIAHVTGISPGGVHLITKPVGACCESERRNLNGGCDNCGAPCL